MNWEMAIMLNLHPMKKRIFIMLLISITCYTCKINKNNDNVTLIAEIKDLPDVVLYIESKDTEQPFLDSVIVKNGKFKYQHNKLAESIMVKLYFFDQNRQKKTICYADPIKNNNVYTQLILENGEIVLQGESYKKVNMDAPNENKLFLAYNQEGVVTKYSTYSPNGVIKDYQVIKDNSKSTYLLRYLYAQKVVMDLKEVKKQFALFDRSLGETSIGKKLIAYIADKERVADEIIDDSYKFSDTAGNKINLKSQLSKRNLSLYIFWASWCVPCRVEIPALKKFYRQYGDRVNLVSLSIDSDFQNWKNAVEDEKMPWLNVASLPDRPTYLKDKFFINSVPQLMLINKSGRKLLSVTNDLDSVENFIAKIR